MTVEPAESSHKWVDFKEADQLIICIRLCERPVFRKRMELLVGFFELDYKRPIQQQCSRV